MRTWGARSARFAGRGDPVVSDPVDWVDLRVGGRAEGVAGVGQRSPCPGRRARGGRGKRGIGHAGRSVPACSAAM
jgi:hypothetical protein